jgi:hypothetical protein
VSAVEYPRFRVWSYARPSGHSKSAGFLRGTSPAKTEWAFALVDEGARPLHVYETSKPSTGHASEDEAIRAARKADWERPSRGPKHEPTLLEEGTFCRTCGDRLPSYAAAPPPEHGPACWAAGEACWWCGSSTGCECAEAKKGRTR